MITSLHIIKVIISAIIIFVATEISNRSTILAAIIIALPLVSIISLTWIWFETKDVEKISIISTQIFWFVIPGLPMFLLIPLFLSKGLNFFISLLISCAITILLFYITQKIISS